MILYINTSADPYKFALIFPDGRKKQFSAMRQNKKDALFYIDRFLRQNGIKLSDLKAIEVFDGQGSFTGRRVGLAIANALGFAIKIPVVKFTSSIIE